MLTRSEALVSAELRAQLRGNTEHRMAVLDRVGAYYCTMGDEKRSFAIDRLQL